jgi:hypothetical protein
LSGLSDEEIEALLDEFIAKYLKFVKPLSDAARDAALDRVRNFLRDSSAADFASADDFASALVKEIQAAYKATFNSVRAVRIVERVTKQIYSFYRLRDTSPFGGKSPVKLKFGAPDKRASDFFGSLDHFYFSTYVNNSKQELKDFLKSEYLDKGAALFGRETHEALDDFRAAAGGKLDNLNDRAVSTIVHSSVQRIRNYAHVNSLSQARIKQARIRAIVDGRCTSQICPYLDGKIVNVSTAFEAVDRLTQLEPGDYALELYKSDLGRSFANDPVDYVKDRISDDGVIDDDLVAEGRGFPPFHPRCRCRLEGVIET